MSKEAVLTVKKLINLSPEIVEAINDWRFKNRINTESEAVRLLISRGLAFDRIADATDPIIEHAMNYVRGVHVDAFDTGKFLDALSSLFDAVDGADEELRESLLQLRAELDEGPSFEQMR